MQPATRRPTQFSLVILLIAISPLSLRADVVTFGSGSNTFELRFQAVLNPGNAADSTNLGSVSYGFGISKFEISERMIDIYNLFPENAQAPVTYRSPGPGYGPNRAATNLTWNEAARFVNWLNTSQGYAPAYRFRRADSPGINAWLSDQTDDYDPLNPYRSKRAVFALPTIDEWYKSAYYDPVLNSSGGYWQYAVKSNSAPNPVDSGTGAGDAVYGLAADASPAEITSAGGLSAYGVMGMNGNVWEWVESSYAGTFGGSDNRILVGGGWAETDASTMDRFSRQETANFSPLANIPQGGFRVISLLHTNGNDDDDLFTPLSSVPEPGSCGIAVIFATTVFGRRIAMRVSDRRRSRSQLPQR